MELYEYVGNLHNHTPYSDGILYHRDMAQAAAQAGLDFLISTDHNIWVTGTEGYYDFKDGGNILILTGEEIHDLDRKPEGSHLLVYDTNTELRNLSKNPQNLIETVAEAGGLSFLAHPFERAAPIVEDAVYSWRDWHVTDYTGLEIWNYMSEFKGLVTSRIAAMFYAFYPDVGISGPFKETIDKWDRLLSNGHRIVATGNADAHGQTYSMGPISRCIFPYKFLYNAVNTHLVSRQKFTGVKSEDKSIVYSALRNGNCFVGYETPYPTRGFRFSAYNDSNKCIMGEEIPINDEAIALKANTPIACNMKILCNGTIIVESQNQSEINCVVSVPGAYRVEATIRHKSQERCWIFSNPIYVVP
jgi:hypothetical protein